MEHGLSKPTPYLRATGHYNRLLFVACLIAWLAAGLPDKTSYAQDTEIAAIHLRSIGQPPEAASRYVATQGLPHRVPLAKAKSIQDATKELCGHESKALLERAAALNTELVTLLGSISAPAPTDTSMLLPACIRSLPGWPVSVRQNEGIGQIVLREFDFVYDPHEPGWAQFANEVCRLNQPVEGFSCVQSAANPKLPIGAIRLPAALARSQIEIDTAQIAVDAFLETLVKELKAPAEAGRFFKSGTPIRAPVVAFPQIFHCLPDNPTEYPYDLKRFLALVAVYTSAKGQRVENAPPSGKPSVITIIDTGIETQNAVLNDLLFKRTIIADATPIADSSSADAVPDEGTKGTGYPNGPFGAVTAADILDPERVLYFHGTHVAGLASGRALATDVLTADEEMRNLGAFWPRLRVFRSLRKSVVTGKYDLGARAISFGLDFTLDRTGGPGEFNVVNISVGASASDEMRSRIESLANYAIVVAAAGNYGLNLTTEVVEKFPAALGGSDPANGSAGAFVISVGASSRLGKAFGWSNYSATNVDLFAVGDCQYSFRETATEKAGLMGTSQAAPWVSLTAALLYQMPLPSKHPSRIKNRIMSTVKSDPQLADKSESGGHLDPLRAVDVLVDHIRIRAKDGSDRFVRALIDYNQSEKPCSGVQGVRNVARYEKWGDESARFRDKLPNSPLSAKSPFLTPLKPCGKINPKAKIRYYADDDFEKLARNEPVNLREEDVANIVEIIPRAFENIGPVATAPQRDPYATVLRETTRIMK